MTTSRWQKQGDIMMCFLSRVTPKDPYQLEIPSSGEPEHRHRPHFDRSSLPFPQLLCRSQRPCHRPNPSNLHPPPPASFPPEMPGWQCCRCAHKDWPLGRSYFCRQCNHRRCADCVMMTFAEPARPSSNTTFTSSERRMRDDRTDPCSHIGFLEDDHRHR